MHVGTEIDGFLKVELGIDCRKFEDGLNSMLFVLIFALALVLMLF